MKAKCPFCRGIGKCDKCKDGFMELKFAKGLVYDLVCKKCGDVLGFHIDDEGNEPPPDPKEEGMCCVVCEDPQDLEWVLASYNDSENADLG